MGKKIKEGSIRLWLTRWNGVLYTRVRILDLEDLPTVTCGHSRGVVPHALSHPWTCTAMLLPGGRM